MATEILRPSYNENLLWRENLKMTQSYFYSSINRNNDNFYWKLVEEKSKNFNWMKEGF